MSLAKNADLDVHIRWMIKRDMPKVMHIENSSFEEPFNEELLTDLLRQRNVIGMVAEKDSLILGFMIYKLHKKVIYVMDLVVAKECRQAAVGSQFVKKLKEKLSLQKRPSIVIDVPETHLGAQLFLKDHEFEATDIVYSGCLHEEVEYRMRYELPCEKDEAAALVELFRRRNRITCS